MADKKRIIDEDIAALFSTQGRFYGLEPAVAETEAIKRIKRNIATLESKAQKVKLDTLEDYEQYKHLPQEEQRKILRYAREKSVSVPAAAKEYFSGAARN